MPGLAWLLHKQHFAIGRQRPEVLRDQAFERVAALAERAHGGDDLVAEVLRVLDGVAVRLVLEQYNKTINIEAQLMVLMANRYILPSGYRFQGELAGSVSAVKTAGGVAKETKKTLDQVTRLVDEAKVAVDELQRLLEHESNGDAVKHAKYFRDKVIPAMGALCLLYTSPSPRD